MIINVQSSLTVFYHIHTAHSSCWNLGQQAQKGPLDSAFPVCMCIALVSLSSLSSYYRFCYKVLSILVIRILACFRLRLAELWVNISSVKLTPKLTFSLSFFPVLMKDLPQNQLHTNVTEIHHQHFKILNHRNLSWR